MVGASGAIGGVMGAYALLYPRAHVHMFIFLGFYMTTIAVPAIYMLGYWFLLQLISALPRLAGDQAGGVAFWAHVGGFVAGLALVMLFKQRERLEARLHRPARRTARHVGSRCASRSKTVDPLADQVHTGLVDTVRADAAAFERCLVGSSHPFPQYAALFRARRDDASHWRDPRALRRHHANRIHRRVRSVEAEIEIDRRRSAGRWHCEQFTARYARARVATVAFVSSMAGYAWYCVAAPMSVEK